VRDGPLDGRELKGISSSSILAPEQARAPDQFGPIPSLEFRDRPEYSAINGFWEGIMAPKRAFLVAAMVLSVAVPVLAHHSLDAEYDRNSQITLTGTVTKVNWSNPHVHFSIHVMKEAGTATWEVEMGSPNAQILGGWKIDTFKPGDRVVISGYPARDGSNLAFARRVSKASR